MNVLKRPRKRLIGVGSGSDITMDLPRKKSRAAGYVAAHLKENELPQVIPIEAKVEISHFNIYICQICHCSI